jgi:hypothetical protein
VRLSPLGTQATSGLLYQPQMIDYGDCGAIHGMKFGRRNRSTRRKSAPMPLCPPQIPHDQTRARTWSAAVGSHRLTAWAMAKLTLEDVCIYSYIYIYMCPFCLSVWSRDNIVWEPHLRSSHFQTPCTELGMRVLQWLGCLRPNGALPISLRFAVVDLSFL